jgi:hypothetical protein
MIRPRNTGVRAGTWSESKATNTRAYDPQQEEISRVIEKYYDEYMNVDEPIFRQMRLHDAFIMPVTLSEIQSVFQTIPKKFTDGLSAVFLLGGAKKQEKSWSTFTYGRYGGNIIYLHPYPKKYLVREYTSPPKPHILMEYKRAGASTTEKSGKFIVEFTLGALRQFYLRDVLMHEIGHHVDRANFGKKSRRREESFAEWFATEYGFRLST